MGHKPSYAIMPRDSVAYGPYDYENDPPMKRNAYIGYSFWNTLYDQDKRYAGGKFAFGSDGSDTLATWVKKNRNIKNKDVVTVHGWLPSRAAYRGLASNVWPPGRHRIATLQLLCAQPRF